MSVVQKIHNILTMIRGFRAGYTSRNDSVMMVSYEGEVYKVTFERVDNGKLEFEHLDLIEDK